MEKSQRQQNSASQAGRRGRSRGIATFAQLLNSALRLLATRPRSTQEILFKLRKYTSDGDLLNQVIEKLKSANFLDDSKFTAWLVESRSRSRPRGQRLLIQELKSKGIDEVTINDNLMTAGEELALAIQALQKKHKIWVNLPAKGYKLKAINYLRFRGFPWGVIETAVKKGYNSLHVS